MGSLGFRSSKLAWRNGALVFKEPVYECIMSNAGTRSSSSGYQSNGTGLSTTWAYMARYVSATSSVKIVPEVVEVLNKTGFSNGTPVARITSAHSHGSSGYNGAMRSENYFYLQDGRCRLTLPAEVSTVTTAKLWLGNAGQIFHTFFFERETSPRLYLNMFDGYFVDLVGPYGHSTNWMDRLNNSWLGVTVSNGINTYSFRLDRVNLASLNAQQGNGKIAAGMGNYTFMYNGKIYLNMPDIVVNMLNTTRYVDVSVGWYWENCIMGPFCLCDQISDGMSNNDVILYWTQEQACASPWATMHSYASIAGMTV